MRTIGMSLPFFLFVVPNGVGASMLNDWQKSVTSIGKALTASDLSGSAWQVEYNSSFPATDVGLILAPSSYDKSLSSLNVVAVCDVTGSATVASEGRDFPEMGSAREVSFGSDMNAPPAFLLGALSSTRAGLAVDRQKTVQYKFDDIVIRQISEGDAVAALNAPKCFNRVRHRKKVFFVRGQFLMRLTMAQIGGTGGGVNASFPLGGLAAGVGFRVKWNSAKYWSIEQDRQRPWFRIVTLFKLSKDGRDFVIAEK